VTVPNPPKYPALLAISPALPAILGISSNFEKVLIPLKPGIAGAIFVAVDNGIPY
jgi:hypothetical protein